MSSIPPPPPGPPTPPGGGFNPPPPSGGFGQPPVPGGQSINNNLAIAIIGTVLGICCCFIGWIPGVIGIVFATQVNGLLAAGDLAGAQSKAKTAGILGWVGLGLGVAGIVSNILWTIFNGALLAVPS